MTQVNAAQDEAWWEEFTQSYGKESLRSLAKRFETTPRRLRRAAQRCGLSDEPEAIKAAAARLGAAPDASLAESLGVTPEQIKGARTRRGIKAFNPRTEPQPKKPRPKKKPEPRPERPRPERRFRSEPIVPTVVVKRSRTRVPTERAPSRVEDSGRRLADTLGRISHEDPSSPSQEDAARREVREARRRRILGPDRLEELRGLKPAVAAQDTSRGRRRRLPRASEPSDGDDDPTGAARERITTSLRRAQAAPTATPQVQAKPPAPKPRPTLRRPSRPIPKFVAPAPEPAPAPQPVAAPAPQRTSAPSASLASQEPVTPKVQQRPAPEPQQPSAPQAKLWTARYRESGQDQMAVIAAPTFVRAIALAGTLGELISVSPAELL